MDYYFVIYDFVHVLRRSLIAQHQAKLEEALEQARALQKAMKTGKMAASVSVTYCSTRVK